MARFKIGQKVWMGRGEHERQLTVKKVIDNPMLPIYQYSFEEVSFVCGEQSIRKNQHGKDLKLSDCFKTNDKEAECRINTITSALNEVIDFNLHGVGTTFSKADVRFKPSLQLIDWLKDYANGRLIIDVGSGQGHLVNMLKRRSFKKDAVKAIGIEPNFDVQTFLKFRSMRGSIMNDVNEIIARTIQECDTLIKGIGDKGMLIFARPKSKDFVEIGIDNMPIGMEALFITTSEEFAKFNYLGRFKEVAKLIKHEGISEDNEIIYSIIR